MVAPAGAVNAAKANRPADRVAEPGNAVKANLPAAQEVDKGDLEVNAADRASPVGPAWAAAVCNLDRSCPPRC